jgi:hypothetical protein
MSCNIRQNVEWFHDNQQVPSSVLISNPGYGVQGAPPIVLCMSSSVHCVQQCALRHREPETRIIESHVMMMMKESNRESNLAS